MDRRMPIEKGKKYLRNLIKLADDRIIENYKKAYLSNHKASKPINEIIRTYRPIYTLTAISFFENSLKREFKPDFIDID